MMISKFMREVKSWLKNVECIEMYKYQLKFLNGVSYVDFDWGYD